MPATAPPLLQEGLDFSFTPLEAALALPASAFCLWYDRHKHWFANNVLGLAFRCAGYCGGTAARYCRAVLVRQQRWNSSAVLQSGGQPASCTGHRSRVPISPCVVSLPL